MTFYVSNLTFPKWKISQFPFLMVLFVTIHHLYSSRKSRSHSKFSSLSLISHFQSINKPCLILHSVSWILPLLCHHHLFPDSYFWCVSVCVCMWQGHVCGVCVCVHGGCGFNPWVRKIPWMKTWQATPVFLPGKSHRQGSLVAYSPQDHKESDMTEVT